MFTLGNLVWRHSSTYSLSSPIMAFIVLAVRLLSPSHASHLPVMTSSCFRINEQVQTLRRFCCRRRTQTDVVAGYCRWSAVYGRDFTPPPSTSCACARTEGFRLVTRGKVAEVTRRGTRFPTRTMSALCFSVPCVSKVTRWEEGPPLRRDIAEDFKCVEAVNQFTSAFWYEVPDSPGIYF